MSHQMGFIFSGINFRCDMQTSERLIALAAPTFRQIGIAQTIPSKWALNSG